MAYEARYNLATDSVFLKQILVAMMNYCATVLTEATNTTAHRERTALAATVLQNPTLYQAKFAFAAITQAGITPEAVPSTVADAAVLAAVTAVWNAMAGYFPN